MAGNTVSMMTKLAEPFPPDKIKQKRGQGGRMMAYISHGLVTERLNQVDPSWSSQVLTEHIYKDAQGRLHCEGVTISLTVNGTTRVEAGGPQRQDGFANEIKNAYSDALKRAAMRFGVALEMWESLVDAEYDEDVHPEYAPVAPAPVARPNPPPTERRQNPSRPPVNAPREAGFAPQGQNRPQAGPGQATEAQVRMLHRLGHKLGWTENDYKRELHNAWDVHSTNDLTKKQASDWISVLKDAAGEEDEPPAQQAPRQQDPAEPEWLAMAPDIGEAGADRWTQA